MASRVLSALGDIVRHLPDVRRDPLAVLDRLAAPTRREEERNLAYGEAAGQTADVYSPESPPGAGPASAVVFFHGGRWSYGRKEEYRFVGRSLAALGHIAVVCDYRKYPDVRFPAFVEDGAAATAWALSELPRRGVDPGRVFLMGHSAGAHIAALATMDRRYGLAHGYDADRLAGLVLMSAPVDFLPIRAADLRDIFGPEEGHAETQPLRYIRAGLPPILLLHGRRDRTVTPSGPARFASAVREAGGDARAVFYDFLTHTSILAGLSDRVGFLFAPVLDHVAAFLAARVSKAEARSTVGSKGSRG